MPGNVLLTSISCIRQVGKIRVRVSALRGNQRYEKAVQLFQVVSDKVNHSGLLDISMTFKHPTVLGVGAGVLQRVSILLYWEEGSLYLLGTRFGTVCGHYTHTIVMLLHCSTRSVTSRTSTSGSRCRPWS